MQAFLSDTSPQALEKVVDHLLASPAFAEHWARHWLDLMRYAESRGHEFDFSVANPYHYRDYVIRAIEQDLPYDRFLIEHLAGDLLTEPRTSGEQQANESILATGFWFLGEWVHSPVDIRKDEADRYDNMVDVFSKAFWDSPSHALAAMTISSMPSRKKITMPYLDTCKAPHIVKFVSIPCSPNNAKRKCCNCCSANEKT